MTPMNSEGPDRAWGWDVLGGQRGRDSRSGAEVSPLLPCRGAVPPPPPRRAGGDRRGDFSWPFLGRALPGNKCTPIFRAS